MSRKYMLLGVVVGVLVIANLWQWWPDMTRQAVTDSVSSGIRVEDIRLRAPIILSKSERIMQRNIFISESEKASRIASTLIKTKQAEKTSKPTRYPAKQIAKVELEGIKVMGIIFRDGKGRAYVTIDESNYTVFKGDKAGRRFVAEKILTDAVVFRDSITGVKSKIIVSGQ